MADEEEKFVPQSDEDLARLFEEQLRLIRGGTADAEPRPENAIPEPTTRDVELDEIFSALLDDDSIEPVQEVTESVPFVGVTVLTGEPEFKPAFDESTLAQTEPIDVVPIPSMFTDDASEEAYIAAALAPEVTAIVSTEMVIEEVRENGITEEVITEHLSIETPVIAEVISESSDEQASDVNSIDLRSSFEKRPSFDELVFGVSSED